MKVENDSAAMESDQYLGNPLAKEYQNDDEERKVLDLVNELLGEDLDNLSGCEAELKCRAQTLQDEISIAKTQVTADREIHLKNLTKSIEENDRIINETKSILLSVEQVSDEVGQSTAQICILNEEKSHLIQTTTLLERLASFLDGVDYLEERLKGGDFGCMSGTMLATIQFARFFDHHKGDCPLVADTLKRLDDFKKSLKRRIFDYFDKNLKVRHAINADIILTLAHGAVLVDILGEQAKRELIIWYCDRQLRDFKTIMHEYADLASLQKRFQWLHRILTIYEAEHAQVFPSDWKVEMALCVDFCSITTKDIREMLHRMGDGVDLEILQMAVQNTRLFEEQLLSRFGVERSSSGINLSSSFESHIFLFVDYHDQTIQKSLINNLPTKLSTVDIDESHLLTSGPRLFLMFRDVLEDISSLSRRKALLDLTVSFQRHLTTFCKYLDDQLLKMTQAGTKPSSAIKINATELTILCGLMNTVDYCQMMTQSLSDRILSLIHPQYTEAISFGSIIQDFLIVISQGITRIHALLDTRLDPVWAMMASVPWQSIETVGDQSEYLVKLQRALIEISLSVGKGLLSAAQYSSICDRLSASLLRKFGQELLLIRPLSEASAQQLHVDLESLRRMLMALYLPNEDASIRASHSRLLKKESRDSENIIKLISCPLDPIPELVKSYLMLFPSSSHQHFQVFLEMRNIKKSSAMAPYLQEFEKLAPVAVSLASLDSGSGSGGLFSDHFKFLRLDSTIKRMLSSGISKLNISTKTPQSLSAASADSLSPQSHHFSRQPSTSHSSPFFNPE